MNNTVDWFSQYCALCAKNVQNRDGIARFDFTDLQVSLDMVANDKDSLVPESVVELMRSIIDVCNRKHGTCAEYSEHVLLLTLLNINAAYLMIIRAWRFD